MLVGRLDTLRAGYGRNGRGESADADPARSANGHTLIAESDRGRVIEVDRAGRILSEFWSPDVVDGKRRAIYRFTRVSPEAAAPWLAGAAPAGSR